MYILVAENSSQSKLSYFVLFGFKSDEKLCQGRGNMMSKVCMHIRIVPDCTFLHMLSKFQHEFSFFWPSGKCIDLFVCLSSQED